MKRMQVLLRTVRRKVRRLVRKSPAKSVAHGETSVAHAHGNHGIDLKQAQHLSLFRRAAAHHLGHADRRLRLGLLQL